MVSATNPTDGANVIRVDLVQNENSEKGDHPRVSSELRPQQREHEHDLHHAVR